MATAGSHALGNVTCFVVRIFPPAALPALFIAADSGGHVGDHPPICPPITLPSVPPSPPIHLPSSPLSCVSAIPTVHVHAWCVAPLTKPGSHLQSAASQRYAPHCAISSSRYSRSMFWALTRSWVCAEPDQRMIGTNDVLLGCSFRPVRCRVLPPHRAGIRAEDGGHKADDRTDEAPGPGQAGPRLRDLYNGPHGGVASAGPRHVAAPKWMRAFALGEAKGVMT